MSQAHTLSHDVEITPVASFRRQVAESDFPVSEYQLQNLTFQFQNTSCRILSSFRIQVSESQLQNPSFRTPVSES